MATIRLAQILRGKKLTPQTELEAAVKTAINNAGGGGGGADLPTPSADYQVLLSKDGDWKVRSLPSTIDGSDYPASNRAVAAAVAAATPWLTVTLTESETPDPEDQTQTITVYTADKTAQDVLDAATLGKPIIVRQLASDMQATWGGAAYWQFVMILKPGDEGFMTIIKDTTNDKGYKAETASGSEYPIFYEDAD